jgi:hypothetical protein
LVFRYASTRPNRARPGRSRHLSSTLSFPPVPPSRRIGA